MLLTTQQFKAVYNIISEHIKKSLDMKMLYQSLHHVDSSIPEAESARAVIEQGEWWSSLVGMDLHPRQNSYQVCALHTTTATTTPTCLGF